MNKYIVDGALLLAFLSAFCTTAAYFFEYGYLIYHSVPTEFIQIDYIKILQAMAVVTVYIGISSFFSLFLEKLLSAKNPLLRIIGQSSLLPFIIFLINLAIGEGIYNWSSYLSAFCLFFILHLTFGFFEKNNNISFLERSAQLYEEKNDTPQKNDNFGNMLMNKVIVPFVILPIVGMFLATSLGRNYASMQNEYWVLTSNSDMLLVRTYGSVAIFRQFDFDKSLASPNILITKIDNENGFSLKKVKYRFSH